MANRRMFSKEVISSDDFIELSKDAQLAYFHLGMVADDDGMLKSLKSILRLYEINKDAIDELTDNGFLIKFDSGVYVIVHWRLSNYLQNDRYTHTLYQKEFSHLKLDSNKCYVLITNDSTDTERIQNVSADKNSIDEISTEEIRVDNHSIDKDISDKDSVESPESRFTENDLYSLIESYVDERLSHIWNNDTNTRGKCFSFVYGIMKNYGSIETQCEKLESVLHSTKSLFTDDEVIRYLNEH